uniref:PDZ domain-containing protein 11 n=1 Tax=Equus asinus TaxID=9793 RepID=A0A9L0K602_EQUAS|nr:PDZ domain-containing protein 11 isoform X1 [Equus asinus]XP_044620233.1 PDZ domain-containing protein 11 isoform X1 [Equus asinus]XP_044620234.1 PDZ domain-containing protein 11 isoform X1 [Equus asinus]XP_044620235.1 PDZ domain-containing protein 11 isoform X1 [Equus asinus]XP_044620236.1 PDZ domain-containing protein 11 isoform X1 [Equus asinus]
MDNRIPYDDYPVVFLPAYENPPAWIPPHEPGDPEVGFSATGPIGSFLWNPTARVHSHQRILEIQRPSFHFVKRVYHPDYNNELTQFLPRIVTLKKPPGAQLGFNIRGGKASQLGIFISKVIPDSDAHRAGLQEGDQVLAVNDVDFQDIEHSKAVDILKTAREISMRVRFFPYNYHRQKERTVH